MSTRFWIGIVQMFDHPGIWTARSSSAPAPTRSARSLRQRTSRRANSAESSSWIDSIARDRRQVGRLGRPAHRVVVGRDPSRWRGRALAMASDPGEGRGDLGVRAPEPGQEVLDRQPGEDGGPAADQLRVERPRRGLARGRAGTGSTRRASPRPAPGRARGGTRRCGGRHIRASGRRTSAGPRRRRPRSTRLDPGPAGPGPLGSGHRAPGRPGGSRRRSVITRRGQRSRGRKLTIVSIMSIGAGSVGVSARPALPTTMSTSGNRQRTMSRAFRSSADCVTDALGTVIGMSITIPSSSGVRNSRAIGVIDDSATSATTTSPRVDPTRPEPPPSRHPRGDHGREQGRQQQRAAPDRREADQERRPQDPGQRGRVVEQVRQGRAIDLDHAPDERAVRLPAEPPPDEDRAERGDQGDRQARRPSAGRTSW